MKVKVGDSRSIEDNMTWRREMAAMKAKGATWKEVGEKHGINATYAQLLVKGMDQYEADHYLLGRPLAAAICTDIKRATRNRPLCSIAELRRRVKEGDFDAMPGWGKKRYAMLEAFCGFPDKVPEKRRVTMTTIRMHPDAQDFHERVTEEAGNWRIFAVTPDCWRLDDYPRYLGSPAPAGTVWIDEKVVQHEFRTKKEATACKVRLCISAALYAITREQTLAARAKNRLKTERKIARARKGNPNVL